MSWAAAALRARGGRSRARGTHEHELLAERGRRGDAELVVDVVVALKLRLEDDARLFQQIVDDAAAWERGGGVAVSIRGARNPGPAPRTRAANTHEPQIWPRPLKCTSIHLPKRELLLLRVVFALPKASSTGFAESSLSCMLPSELPAALAK